MLENSNEKYQNAEIKAAKGMPAMAELNQRFLKCYGMSDDYLTEIEVKVNKILSPRAQEKRDDCVAMVDPTCALEELLLRIEEWERINRRLQKVMGQLQDIV
jgi:hypothetical protein